MYPYDWYRTRYSYPGRALFTRWHPRRPFSVGAAPGLDLPAGRRVPLPVSPTIVLDLLTAIQNALNGGQSDSVLFALVAQYQQQNQQALFTAAQAGQRRYAMWILTNQPTHQGAQLAMIAEAPPSVPAGSIPDWLEVLTKYSEGFDARTRAQGRSAGFPDVPQTISGVSVEGASAPQWLATPPLGPVPTTSGVGYRAYPQQFYKPEWGHYRPHPGAARRAYAVRG
jgi:hypothetical protein